MEATLHKHATFQYFSATNKSRALLWHKGGLEEWSNNDWATAVTGELGELCNVLKKMRRVEMGINSNNNEEMEKLRQMAADEIADTFTYLDLLAQRMGFDLYEIVADKFNRISEREGFPHRLI